MTLSATDRLDIVDLYTRASYHLDFCEPEKYVALFTADGVLVQQVGDAEVQRCEGTVQLLGFACSEVARVGRASQHWTANILIALSDDGASGTCHAMTVVTDVATRTHQIAFAGQYRDRFVRTGAGWRFRERRVVGPW
jgi:hypothetical protein